MSDDRDDREKDRGPWIHTWSGGRFHYLDPRVEEVILEDIAHALSLQCRFNGHVDEHYSVAEHSVLVADMVYSQTNDPTIALAALLHDAAEAYIGDVVSPLKKLLAEYKDIESRVETCVASRFGVEYPWVEEIHVADKLILNREFSSIAPFADEDHACGTLSPKTAEKRFLQRFGYYSELMESRG